MPPKPPAKTQLRPAPPVKKPLWERAVEAFHARGFAVTSAAQYHEGLADYGELKPSQRDYHLTTLVFRGVQGIADCAASLRSIDATLRAELPALRRRIAMLEDTLAGEEEEEEEEEEPDDDEDDGDEDEDGDEDDGGEGDDDEGVASVEAQMEREYEQQQRTPSAHVDAEPAKKPARQAKPRAKPAEPAPAEPEAVTPDAVIPAPPKPARGKKPQTEGSEG